jgi:hypothetical protein
MGSLQVRQLVSRYQQAYGARLSRHSLDESEILQPHQHRMCRFRRDPKVPGDVGFGGRAAVQLGIPVGKRPPVLKHCGFSLFGLPFQLRGRLAGLQQPCYPRDMGRQLARGAFLVTASVLRAGRHSPAQPRNGLVLLAAGPNRIPAPKGLCLECCQGWVLPCGACFLPGYRTEGGVRLPPLTFRGWGFQPHELL